MKCTQCAAEIVAEAAYCHQCGASTSGAAQGSFAGAAAPSPAVAEAAQADRRKRAGGFISGDPRSDEPEEILWQGTFSKLGMIGSWIAAAAVTVGMMIAGLAGKFSGQNWLVVVGLLIAGWVLLIGRLFYLQLSTHYYLTNQRFIHERGLLWREIDRIETIDVDDVTCQQGPVERMLGAGTIRLKASDQSTPEFVLVGIEDVRSVASLIDEARRKERRKRGLYVESV